MPPDEELAALIQTMARGDRGAVAPLYRHLGPRLYAVAYRILRDQGLAEDAVQDAFVKIWRNAHRFDPAKGAAGAWAAVIARRAALDRKPKTPVMEPVELEAVTFDPDYVHPRLKACLDALPQAHRNALVMMYVYGLSHSELAERLNAPLGTVKSWVRRASQTLKESLER
jgi:RNA polymerase sigma-70 factor (ECF subfamily)